MVSRINTDGERGIEKYQKYQMTYAAIDSLKLTTLFLIVMQHRVLLTSVPVLIKQWSCTI